SRGLSASLEHVQHAEAVLHEGAQPLRTDQAAVAVDQPLPVRLDSDAWVLHEEMTHVFVEQLADRFGDRGLQEVYRFETFVDLERTLSAREAMIEAAWPQREGGPVGPAILEGEERHATLLDVVADARVVVEIENQHLQAVRLAAQHVNRMDRLAATE